MKKVIFAVLCGFFVSLDANAVYPLSQAGVQTIHVETPVLSYYAYPDDPNFIPETNFMREDSDFNYDANIEYARQVEATNFPGVIFASKPMVICRDFRCTRLNENITKTFLFNSIANMFMLNSDTQLNICEADPFSRSCLQTGISFPVQAGAANAMIKIPKAAISQVTLSTGMSRASVGTTFEFLVNGISRACDQTLTDIVIPVNSQATLATREFSCDLTSDGVSNISLLVNLDYIDLDYGIMGGYYSLGMQGPTSGGGTGYVLFKTEYTNSGYTYQADGVQSYVGPSVQSIRPGEYAVEPLSK